jgi:carbon storage regulator CsrA
MLVLSRRPKQKILFPELGVSVEVCTIAKNAVRLGIEAPPSISIVREEIAFETARERHGPPGPSRHELLNRLHTAGLAIQVAQKQLQAGLVGPAQASLEMALRQHADIERELAPERVEPTATVTAKREIRALVVDDNRNECALLAEFLRLNGVDVATAADGHEALDYLRGHDRPDVILLDMRMPRCDGPATVAAIRGSAALQGLKVFAVTGADPRECPVPNGPDGIDGWFSKPLDPTRLIHELNQALGRN